DRHAGARHVSLLVGQASEDRGVPVPYEKLRLDRPGRDDGRVEGDFGGRRVDLLGDAERDVAIVADRGSNREFGSYVLELDDLIAQRCVGRERALYLDERTLTADQDLCAFVVRR